MSGIKSHYGVEHFESLLKEKADKLVVSLGEGDIAAAMDQINDLYEVRHKLFFHEIGTLTRALHEAIKTFGADFKASIPGDHSSAELSDASASLDYVVELTEKNAHETMDRLDRALMALDLLEKDGPGSDAAEQLSRLREELTGILVAQGYQDIAGQLIKRVIELVTRVEQQLVHLMDVASSVDRLTGGAPVEAGEKKQDAETEKKVVAEGPQIKGKSDPNVVCEQDDVDDLLSSLGF